MFNLFHTFSKTFRMHTCMLNFFYTFSLIVLMISFLTRSTIHQTLKEPNTTTIRSNSGRKVVIDSSWVFIYVSCNSLCIT